MSHKTNFKMVVRAWPCRTALEYEFLFLRVHKIKLLLMIILFKTKLP